MIRSQHSLLWLFDQVAFEYEFALPDRNTMLAVRSYWHEPTGDADGTVTVFQENGTWVAHDAAHVIARTSDVRAVFEAADQYIKQQESAIAL